MQIFRSIKLLGVRKFIERLKYQKNWNTVICGMTLQEAEEIMGFSFTLESKNTNGRRVYSYHSNDYLPFYLVVNNNDGLISRKHNIRALDDLIRINRVTDKISNIKRA